MLTEKDRNFMEVYPSNKDKHTYLVTLFQYSGYSEDTYYIRDWLDFDGKEWIFTEKYPREKYYVCFIAKRK